MLTPHANLESYVEREFVGKLVPDAPLAPGDRREVRYDVRKVATLYPVDTDTRDRFEVFVMDVSASGMKVRVERPLQPGQLVQVLLDELFALGEVRYCLEAAGRYNVGLKLVSVLLPKKRQRAR